MAMIKFFLDTNILLSIIFPKRIGHKYSRAILRQKKIPLYTNEYVLKEVRRALYKEYKYTTEKINKIVECFRETITIIKNPSKAELRTIQVKDKSDRPIIKSAMTSLQEKVQRSM
ncbi:MAG TPA: PIN domain-containing protein [Methanosarcinales archaeon]|nr:PIN domain-containing protein [Methanosarcinales archaeon]